MPAVAASRTRRDELTPQGLAASLMARVQEEILGQDSAVELAVVCLLAGGHLLIEGPPGLGKTRLAHALADAVGGTIRRIQCTPDLLPSDVTGTSIFDQRSNDFAFVPGPIFANVVVADEINRATPKAQSAFLEAMEEHQVTESGTTYDLEPPFLVIATQNPVDFEGTYPLPEAQLDRFMVRLVVEAPDVETVVRIAALPQARWRRERRDPVLTLEGVVAAREQIAKIRIDEEVIRYAAKISARTRQKHVRLGASPRATMALVAAARALAVVRDRDFVIPDDVADLAHPVLEHRILLDLGAALDGVTPDKVVAVALGERAPTEPRSR